MQKIISFIVNTIFSLGYPGIIALMFLESSFFPFPSEVVVPPAGYLASQGKMNLLVVVLCGIIGSVLGALFNYYIALLWGRKFILKYGKYFFLNERRLNKCEVFFEKHGHISTFIGRLLPGIRQYISFPAGLGRMNLFLFIIFTALGAGIWVAILAYIGYWVGNNKDLIMKYSHTATVGLVVFCFLIGVFYIYKIKRKATS